MHIASSVRRSVKMAQTLRFTLTNFFESDYTELSSWYVLWIQDVWYEAQATRSILPFILIAFLIKHLILIVYEFMT